MTDIAEKIKELDELKLKVDEQSHDEPGYYAMTEKEGDLYEALIKHWTQIRMALSALEHTEQQRVVDPTSTPEPAYQDRGSVDGGVVSVPREPGRLMSMAIRADHALGCPGYYDQPFIRGIQKDIPASPARHQQSVECGLDRSASRSAGYYVCGCGWINEGYAYDEGNPKRGHTMSPNEVRRLRRDRAKLIKALSYCVGYLEDSYAGTPQGEPGFLKKYRRLLARLEEKR